MNPIKTLFSNTDLWSRLYYLGATHNVFKFLEVGIMAEGGDDSAQDIHQPSNRNVHFWQNYYSIFENQDPPPTHARYSDTRNDTE